MIVGLTGSVAAGKSTLASAIAESLSGTLRVDMIQTDAFLLPNAELDARGLSLRKVFPESYDIARLRDTLDDARHAPVRVPGYSHTLYDVDESLSRTIDRPDLLLVEGLGLAPVGDDHRAAHALDALLLRCAPPARRCPPRPRPAAGRRRCEARHGQRGG